MSDPGDEEVATEIVAHYERADEASRLDGGIGLIERDRTRQLVERYLLAPPGVVLDVGGGAGVHALWLAEAGYEVHLSDPVPKHVEQIRSRSGPGGPSGNETTEGAKSSPRVDDRLLVTLGERRPQPGAFRRARYVRMSLCLEGPAGA